jgi:hypothetical protein
MSLYIRTTGKDKAQKILEELLTSHQKDITSYDLLEDKYDLSALPSHIIVDVRSVSSKGIPWSREGGHGSPSGEQEDTQGILRESHFRTNFYLSIDRLLFEVVIAKLEVFIEEDRAPLKAEMISGDETPN